MSLSKTNPLTKLSVFQKRLLMCVLPFVLMVIARLINLTDEADMRVVVRLALIGIALFGAYKAYRGRLTPELAITLLILAGIIMRWGYTMYTDPYTRAHDIGSAKTGSVGHAGYIAHLMEGHLPDGNNGQYYHPPLFYLLSAALIKIGTILSGAKEWKEMLYLAQMISCVAACVTLVFIAQILEKFNFNKLIQFVSLLIIVVFPAQILAAGRVNGDYLSVMCMVIALYYTILWHDERRMKHIVPIALAIGLGMMSKINCGLVAFVTGPVMIYHFVKTIKEKDFAALKSLIIQFLVFGAICFPLALWHPIRNYILYDQPIGHVLRIDPKAPIYNGNEPFVERWLHIPFTKFVETPYMIEDSDTSIWMAFIKTGVHGEFKYDGLAPLLAWGLEYVNTLMLILTLAAVAVVCGFHKELGKKQRFCVLWVWVLFLVSYIQFNAQYPYMCTADFRYVLVWQFASSVFIGCFVDWCRAKRENKAIRVIGAASVILTILFCAMCVIHYF